jgi:peptide/nickel transport system substrate-binding protein
VQPTLWRFNLRRGVRFHDGTPFTASDVVFSIERAQQPTSKFASYALPLGKVTRIDDHTIELRQTRPNPILLEHLLMVFIMSRPWAAAHGAEQVPDLKAAAEAHSNRHAMGTGRYMLRQYEPGVRTLLSRHAAWWGRFEGNVEQVVFMPVGSDATRTAALLSGDIDFMQDVPAQDLGRIGTNPALRVLTGTESRLIFFGFDQFRDELLYASVKGRNPFKDVRVREAFFRAIDVETLNAKIMRGHSQPTACLAVATAGCLAPALERHPPADMARAKQLMAEAGYAAGFELTVDCPNDRYINDRALCVAVGGMLARIGVKLSVDARTKTQYFPKLQRHDTSFFINGYGYSGVDAQQLLDPVLHSVDGKSRKGDVNYGRFADAELDGLIDAAGAEMDAEKRAALIRAAQQLAFDRFYVLPVHRQTLIWAARTGVRAVMTADNKVRVDWIRVE